MIEGAARETGKEPITMREQGAGGPVKTVVLEGKSDQLWQTL